MSDIQSFFNEVQEASNKKLDEYINKTKAELYEVVKNGKDCIRVEDKYPREILEKSLGSLFVCDAPWIFLNPDVDKMMTTIEITLTYSKEDFEIIGSIAHSLVYYLEYVKRQIKYFAETGVLSYECPTCFPLFLKKSLGDVFSYKEDAGVLTISWDVK